MRNKKFTKILLAALKKVSESAYPLNENGERIENEIIYKLENYVNCIHEEEDTYFKYLDDFFAKIPREVWDNAAETLAPMIEILSYQRDTELYNERTKKLRIDKASRLKKSNIKNLEKALPILEKLYEIRIGNKIIQNESDIPDDMIDDFPPKYLDGIRAINTLIQTIKDIKSGEYDQGFYYEQKQPTKAKIETYLEELNKSYNAKGSGFITKFLDGNKDKNEEGIQFYQYAEHTKDEL